MAATGATGMRPTVWRRIKRGHPWRIWRVYHTRAIHRLPTSERSALRCPAVGERVERNTRGAGSSGFDPGDGPFDLICPCGVESRWYYQQQQTRPPVPGWKVEPWPGMETAGAPMRAPDGDPDE